MTSFTALELFPLASHPTGHNKQNCPKQWNKSVGGKRIACHSDTTAKKHASGAKRMSQGLRHLLRGVETFSSLKLKKRLGVETFKGQVETVGLRHLNPFP